MIRATLTAMLMAFGLAACTALVPDEIPTFTCIPHESDACASGSYCSAAGSCAVCQADELACDGIDEDCDGDVDDGSLCGNGLCVAGRCEAGDAGPVLTDSGPPPDVYTCSSANCPTPSACDPASNRCIAGASAPEGAPCVADSVCTTGICANSGMVPAAWTNAGRFCTKTCCSSNDCAAGSVCAQAGTGGRYCVKASLVGIAGVGTKRTGESCVGPEACRSGRCEGGSCTDACCTDSSCGSGQRCTVVAVATGTSSQSGLHCRASRGSSAASRCTSTDDCSSGVCRVLSTNILEPKLCMASCCSSASCGNAIGLLSIYRLRCSYERPDGATAVVATCREGANPSGKRIGEACLVDGDCFSNQCDSVLGKCTDVCCTHDDCSREAAGWRCVPSSRTSPFAPRCQPPG